MEKKKIKCKREKQAFSEGKKNILVKSENMRKISQTQMI